VARRGDHGMARHPIGLALAGGGPEGAIYEIGVLRALDEALVGLDLNDLHCYVGVSSGAFIAANLANQITPSQMCRAIVKHEPGEHPFVPETFFTPAVGQFVKSGLAVPRLLLDAFSQFLLAPHDLTLLESLTRLSHALPIAVFDNEPIRSYLRKIYSIKGRSDDFRALSHPLYVIAADLDSATAVRFGEPGWDHVPISRAVQASSALPGLYGPVEIDGRNYVDGVLLKTLHASVALDAGAQLLFCVNPIVPVDTEGVVTTGLMTNDQLVSRGLPSVLSQTFRTLIHSRLRVGMGSYVTKYPDADVLLIEPPPNDFLMFFTNIFSFSARKQVCQHAYQATRRQLLGRRHELEPLLARHGIRMRIDVLEDPARDLWSGVGLPAGGRFHRATTSRLGEALDRLERLLERRAVAAAAADEAAADFIAPN